MQEKQGNAVVCRSQSFPLNFRELTSLVFDGSCKLGDILLLFKVYLDESSDEKQEKVAAVGGFIGEVRQWKGFSVKWFKRLTRNEIDYFRSAEYYSLTEQFRQFRNPTKYPKPTGSLAAKAVLDSLESLIQKTELVGVGLCILMDDWKAAVKADPDAPQILTNPYEIATQFLISEIHKVISAEVGKGNRIAFIADESQAAQRIEKVYLEFKRVNPGLTGLKSFTHLDDKTCAYLQAADMMAGLSRQAALDSLKNGGALVEPRRLEDRISFIKCLDRNFLEEIIKKEKYRRSVRN